LDSEPTIFPAGDRIPEAAGRAKQLMKNLRCGGCRKSSNEDFDFLRQRAGSALLQSIPADPLRDLAQIVALRAHRDCRDKGDFIYLF
jgi:hypothetical protein